LPFSNTMILRFCRALFACALLSGYPALAGDNVSLEFSGAERAQLQAFGPWPSTPGPDPGNELSGLAWAERLGEQLFVERDLSANGSLSCATCHVPQLGFTDGRARALGAALHTRNTQGLLNAGLQRWFGWGGGTDSLWAASLRPILSPVEMAGDIGTIAERLRGHAYFTDALEDAGLSVAMDDESLVVLAAKAIAAYTRTLESGQTTFDRFRESLLYQRDQSAVTDYPLAAQRGLKIFFGAGNCHVCHFGPDFSNREFHDTGRPFFSAVGEVDSGRYAGIRRVREDRYNLTGPFNGTGVEDEVRKTTSVKLVQSNFGQWRTPSLRNLTATAPYMHDGSLATLRDVVDAYADINPDRLHSNGEAILKPLALTGRDRDDLVAFLRSLSVD
jgi:cytochrome c peroxidase